MKKLFCLVWVSFLVCTASLHAFTIKATYDSSVTSLTNAAQIESAFAAAVATFQSLYTNNATINITVYWGPGGPFTNGINLSRSFLTVFGTSYPQITNALFMSRASAADTNSVASLPATDPTGGGPWWMPRAQIKVLGLPISGVSPNDSVNDGAVGFTSNAVYALDPANRAVAGEYDFIGAAQHEISEVLGRITLGLQTNVGFLPFDLFRFTNNAARSFDPNANNAYFSVDNGATALNFYYTNANLGDIQDWKSGITPDAYDAFVPEGVVLPISTVDIATLDVLGYNGPGLAAPRLAAGKLSNGSFQIGFVGTPGTMFTVLASTNLTLPTSNWAIVGTATEGAPGQFQFIDSSPAASQRFYQVRSQ
ncbi:MAG TPA: NF038122 family metalloprotease [Verrucomicrobiae bacterium]|nr:NF038122 family metalloprotease [Verrucomicrobiae bacterium]